MPTTRRPQQRRAPQRQPEPTRAVAVPTRGQEVQQRAIVAVTRELDNRLAIIQASKAAGIDAERLKVVAITAFTRTPALWECSAVSIARAVVEAGQLGLEPTGRDGGGWLVPYNNSHTGVKEAQFIPSYVGLARLARNSGEVTRVEARVVLDKDEFDYGYGLDPYLTHKPGRGDRGELAFAYAVAYFKSGEKQFDVMDRDEIEAIRRRSKAGSDGPWVTDYFEMSKKTPLRRLCKLLPLSYGARRLLELEDEAEGTALVAGPATPRPGSLAAVRGRLAEQLAGEGGSSGNGTDQQEVDGEVREVPAGEQGVADPKQQGSQSPAPQAADPAIGQRGDEPKPTGAAPAPVACGAVNGALDCGPCVKPAEPRHNEHLDERGQTYSVGRQ